jgi:hypothetical protein
MFGPSKRWTTRLGFRRHAIGLGLAALLLGTTLVQAQGAAPNCPICDLDMATYAGPLAEGEAVALLEALNDEYFALSIYEQVLADHGTVRPFSNIRNAEARHIDMLRPLFETYVLPWPDNPWPGNVPAFDSVQAACVAGVVAEVDNGALYDVILTSTPREDILTVYRALRRASLDNHLPAFRRCAGDAAPAEATPRPTSVPTPDAILYLPSARVSR